MYFNKWYNLIFKYILNIFRRRSRVFGIATGYGLADWGVGVRVPIGSRIFSKYSRPALGSTQPPIQWVPGVKRPGREADHSLLQLVPRSRKCGSIHTLPISLHGVVLNSLSTGTTLLNIVACLYDFRRGVRPLFLTGLESNSRLSVHNSYLILFAVITDLILDINYDISLWLYEGQRLWVAENKIKGIYFGSHVSFLRYWWFKWSEDMNGACSYLNIQ
jgi:hypothetical protein